MPVLLPQRHGVLSVQYCICAVGRDRLALQEQCLGPRLGRVGLPKAGLVQLLEVDYPPQLAGLLGDNVHGHTPYSRLDHQLWPDDAHVGVSVEPVFCLLPVDGHRPVLVDGKGPCLAIDEQLSWSALRGRQLLPLAFVEVRAGVVLPYDSLELS